MIILLAGGGEEERKCISHSAGQLLIVQLPVITVTVCLVSS